MPSSDSATYSYDPDGRRIQSVDNGVTTHYLWDELSPRRHTAQATTTTSRMGSNSMELNRYGYAAGNPVLFSDPSGFTATAGYGAFGGISGVGSAGVSYVQPFITSVIFVSVLYLAILPALKEIWNKLTGRGGQDKLEELRQAREEIIVNNQNN